jgi:hypothetical protein
MRCLTCTSGLVGVAPLQVPFLSREREAASGQAVVLLDVCVHALSELNVLLGLLPPPPRPPPLACRRCRFCLVSARPRQGRLWCLRRCRRLSDLYVLVDSVVLIPLTRRRCRSCLLGAGLPLARLWYGVIYL